MPEEWAVALAHGALALGALGTGSRSLLGLDVQGWSLLILGCCLASATREQQLQQPAASLTCKLFTWTLALLVIFSLFALFYLITDDRTALQWLLCVGALPWALREQTVVVRSVLAAQRVLAAKAANAPSLRCCAGWLGPQLWVRVLSLAYASLWLAGAALLGAMIERSTSTVEATLPISSLVANGLLTALCLSEWVGVGLLLPTAMALQAVFVCYLLLPSAASAPLPTAVLLIPVVIIVGGGISGRSDLSPWPWTSTTGRGSHDDKKREPRRDGSVEDEEQGGDARAPLVPSKVPAAPEVRQQRWPTAMSTTAALCCHCWALLALLLREDAVGTALQAWAWLYVCSSWLAVAWALRRRMLFRAAYTRWLHRFYYRPLDDEELEAQRDCDALEPRPQQQLSS